ncbi:hypothetical protein K461DRAFT_318551 [Myriangium duriaei CBS 260.36]|uniref:Rhodopsin domain-containing protein n=1 Tax=Myriangium duriaei CBS 260.36 TaxID=1168546 RepID=A0A9P4J6C4_9PEZI|nr:hypothetical protein K461DRAFT_318551 [Myriangium duriaei CBS 260.36]
MVIISNDAAAALYTSLTMIAITWIAVGLRFYTRAVIVRNVGADDWAMFVTSLFFTAFCFTLYQSFATTTYGGVNSFQNLNLATQYLFATFCIYIVCSVALKISLMLFFLRIIILPWQRWTLYICTGAFALFGTGFFFETLFECGAPTKYLMHRLSNKCLPKDKIGIPLAYSHGVLNAVVDWIYTGIAIMVITSLQMSRKHKRLAVTLLVIGGLASVCSLVRIGWIHQLDTQFVKIFVTGFDIGTLSCLEIGLGIVATSLATLKPLFVRLNLQRFRANTGESCTDRLAGPPNTLLARVETIDDSLAKDLADRENGIIVVREHFLTVEQKEHV